MTTTCMLTEISFETLHWSPRPWITISPVAIKHCLFVQAPIWTLKTSLWLVSIKSAASRLFEPLAKRYSSWAQRFCCCHGFVFYQGLHLKPKPKHSNIGMTTVSSLISPKCRGFMILITFGELDGLFNDPSSTARLSLVGEECIVLNTDDFMRIQFFLENSLEALLNSKIRYDFKECLHLFVLGLLFFNTHSWCTSTYSYCPWPAPLSPNETLAVSVFIWCADSAAQAEKEWEETEKKEERTVKVTSEKQEFGLSAQSLCRGCCFWTLCTVDYCNTAS